MKINKFPNGILYIEDAFPQHKEFIDFIEKENLNKDIHSVIPKWDIWSDGVPVKVIENGQEVWKFVETEDQLKELIKDNLDTEQYKDQKRAIKDDNTPYQPGGYRGFVKLFDWDLTANRKNEIWPRINVNADIDTAHTKSYEAIKMIEDPFLETIKIWQESIGAKDLQYVSRNYCLRKYDLGGFMGPHVDRNYDHKDNTMDWTALIYLNDDYEGGELVFTELDFSIKPKAGSIVFLPCDAIHEVREVSKNYKYYLFFFLHLDLALCTALGESYHQLNKAILEKMGSTSE